MADRDEDDLFSKLFEHQRKVQEEYDRPVLDPWDFLFCVLYLLFLIFLSFVLQK